MKIEEQDIFKFVYNPKGLGEDKYNYIKSNSEKFAKELDFYTKLKIQQDKPIAKNVLDKIITKINEYNIPELEFLKIEIPEDDNKEIIHDKEITLKPESGNTHGKFVDENSNFVVKLVHRGTSSAIYLSNKDNTPILNFTITINSTKEVFTLKDNSEPLVIPRIIELKDIRLSFK